MTDPVAIIGAGSYSDMRLMQIIRSTEVERLLLSRIVVDRAPEPYADTPATPLLDRPKTHPRSPRESLRRGR